MFYPVGNKKGVNLTRDCIDDSVWHQYNISDKYILEKFYKSIVFGEEQICPARSGLASVCAVEASRIACETGNKIFLSEILS